MPVQIYQHCKHRGNRMWRMLFSYLSTAQRQGGCWEPFYPPAAHDNKVFLHMWFNIGCRGSAYLKGGTELMAVLPLLVTREMRFKL